MPTVESGGTQVVLGTGAVAIAATVDNGRAQSVTGTAKYWTLSGWVEDALHRRDHRHHRGQRWRRRPPNRRPCHQHHGEQRWQRGRRGRTPRIGRPAATRRQPWRRGRDTTVNSGGTEFVHVSAHAISTTLNSGGTEFRSSQHRLRHRGERRRLGRRVVAYTPTRAGNRRALPRVVC